MVIPMEFRWFLMAATRRGNVVERCRLNASSSARQTITYNNDYRVSSYSYLLTANFWVAIRRFLAETWQLTVRIVPFTADLT